MQSGTLPISVIKSELKKCAADPVYFLKSYVRIHHSTKGLIPFTTYEFQDEVLESFEKNRFNIILKSRQLGLSTITAGYVLWFTLFRRSKNVIIVATKQETAKLMLNSMKNMHESLPDFIKNITQIKKNNEKEIRFSNGSSFKALSSAGNSTARGEAISLLIIDEAAHVEGLDGDNGMWTAIYPALSEGGSCIAISTPAGASGWFYDMCTGAEKGENDFHLSKFMWDQHPNRDQAWFEKETRNMKKRQIAQELLCSFLGSGSTLIEPEKIIDLECKLEERIEHTSKQKYGDPLYKTLNARSLWVWKEPVEGHSYTLCADVARGDAADYSTIEVIDNNTLEQVAEYQAKVDWDSFVQIIYDVGITYNKALVVVEKNNLGFAVLTELEKLDYPNLFYSKNGEFVPMFKAKALNADAGFTMSQSTRPVLLAKLEEYVREDLIQIRSVRLVSEFRTFVWDKSGLKASAQTGKNDDLVIAFGMACYVHDLIYNKNSSEASKKKFNLSRIRIVQTSYDLESDPSKKSSSSVTPPLIRTGSTIKRESRQKVENFYKEYGWIIK